MTEQDLIELGFKKVVVNEEESGSKAFHYYTWDLNKNSCISLITPANDEIDGDWYVDFYDDNNIRFTDRKELGVFMDIVKRNCIR